MPARATTSDAARLGSRFLALWIATSVSTIGDGIRLAALPLLAASISGDPLSVALVAMSGQLPWLVTSLPGGAIADRADRRQLMWTVDALRAALMAALALLVVRGEVSVAALCVAAFLLGVGQTVFDNAGHAILPAIVPRTALLAANGRLASARTATLSFVGPPAGAAVFAVWPAGPFLIDALSFLVAAAVIGLFVRPAADPAAVRPASTSLWSDVREGLRWTAGQPVLRAVAALVAVVNLTQAATQGVLVLFALEELHLGRGAFGLMLMASGAGGVLGGVCGPLLRRRVPPGVLFATTILVTVPIFSIIALTSNAWIAGLMLALNAFAGVTAGVLLQTIRQLLVPAYLLARVNSIMLLIGAGIGLPAGSLAGGLLADALGLRAPMMAAALLVAATSFAVPAVSRALNAVNQRYTEPDDDLVQRGGRSRDRDSAS